MAFTSTTQVDNLRAFGVYYCTLFRGTAGAADNVITVDFGVDFIFGAPNVTFSQSARTVTVSGLVDTEVANLILIGDRAL